MGVIDDIKAVIVDSEARIKESQIAIDILKESGVDVKQRQTDLNASIKRIDGLKRGIAKHE